MSDKIYCVIVYVIYCAANVRSDFDCLCNYNVEKGIYPSASENGQPIGYLYEFDCKPVVHEATYSKKSKNNWITIAFEHQKGYIVKDDQTRIQVCPGESTENRLTTAEVHTAQTSLSTLSLPSITPVPQNSASTTLSSSSALTKATNISTISPTTTIQHTETTTPVIETTTTSTASSTATTQIKTSVGTLTSSIKTTSTVLSSGTRPAGITTVGKVMCPLAVQQRSQQERSTLFINTHHRTCYELVPNRHNWEYAEKDCQSNGGHLATIRDLKDEDVVYKYVKSYSHAVWIGLHDMGHEENFVWSSGEPVVYLNWHPGRKDIYLHGIEDCVSMGPLTGTWEDMDCLNTYSYICEYAAVNGSKDNVQSTVPSHNGSYPDGNTAMCPSSVKSTALRDNGVLGQYERNCYELLSHDKVSWEHGENMCKSRGGHLAHISTEDEQGFIQSFMTHHLPKHAVWIGLHDTIVEGQLQWTSGTAVTYTNWIPGHLSNFQSFRTEDCVAFIPYTNGQWDDIPCGDSLFLFGDTGETHPILCQYELTSSPQIVG